MREGLNEHQRTMRLRGRPKVLLATSFEEAIGWLEDVDFEEVVLDLNVGDRVFLYSDGVPEAMDGQLEQYGDDVTRMYPGAKVLLVEATGCLGGMGTAALVNAYDPMGDGKRLIGLDGCLWARGHHGGIGAIRGSAAQQHPRYQTRHADP